MIASWQESNGKPRQCVEKQRCYSADKGPYSQSYGLPSGQIWLWSWTIKKAEYQRIDAFELWHWRRLLKVLYRKKIKTVNLKGAQSWIFSGRTDAEAPVSWSSNENRWFIHKVLDAGKDWWQNEKRVSEDEMAEWQSSPVQWTWTWENSRRRWGTGNPGVLQAMCLQRVKHNWVTEQQEEKEWWDYESGREIF